MAWWGEGGGGGWGWRRMGMAKGTSRAVPNTGEGYQNQKRQLNKKGNVLEVQNGERREGRAGNG
jgi:hypothetical protein